MLASRADCEYAAIIRRGDAAGKAVEWDDVSALGKDGNAIDNEFKRAPPLIELAMQLDGA